MRPSSICSQVALSPNAWAARLASSASGKSSAFARPPPPYQRPLVMPHASRNCSTVMSRFSVASSRCFSPVIAANRALLMSLIATNFLGINTPAIAATEAHYGEMWAQDAAAMYAYAGSSAAAAMLTPMAVAPPTTNPAGSIGMTTQAVSTSSVLPSALNSSASTLLSGFETGISNSVGLLSTPLGQGTSGLQQLLGVQTSGLGAAVHAPAAPLPAQMRMPGVERLVPAMPRMHVMPEMLAPARPLMLVAVAGQAASVGSLSVPPSWATATPEAAALAAAPLASAGAGAPRPPPKRPCGPGGGYGDARIRRCHAASRKRIAARGRITEGGELSRLTGDQSSEPTMLFEGDM